MGIGDAHRIRGYYAPALTVPALWMRSTEVSLARTINGTGFRGGGRTHGPRPG